MKQAYFAGGCFWCITPFFAELAGVESVISGFSGGKEANPAYAAVKAQQTGHRETICVTYDPQAVTYGDLLDLFLKSVDPFDGGGQFVDRGRSYTLAVYYTDESEKAALLARLDALERQTGKTPCVAAEPFTAFWPAEELHQDYYKKNPEAFQKEWETSGRTAACPLHRK